MPYVYCNCVWWFGADAGQVKQVTIFLKTGPPYISNHEMASATLTGLSHHNLRDHPLKCSKYGLRTDGGGGG